MSRELAPTSKSTSPLTNVHDVVHMLRCLDVRVNVAVTVSFGETDTLSNPRSWFGGEFVEEGKDT
jgi:hypothetical protein